MQSQQFQTKRALWVRLNNEFDQMFLDIVDNPSELTKKQYERFIKLREEIYTLEGGMFEDTTKHLLDS